MLGFDHLLKLKIQSEWQLPERKLRVSECYLALLSSKQIASCSKSFVFPLSSPFSLSLNMKDFAMYLDGGSDIIMETLQRNFMWSS